MNIPTTTTTEDLDIINNHVLPCLYGTKPFFPRRGPGILMGYTEVAYFEAVLSHLRPQCAIEVGTETGSTLAIIAKYSQRVVSIDIDPRVRTGLSNQFPNVIFVTGSSHDILPATLEKITEQGLFVDFVFIDADHSADGVRRDIEALLAYRPKTKLIVMMHDSFNPDCRKGILAADWASCPYCHFVEIDFAPGALHPDAPIRRQMWGGLGFALFQPEPRTHELRVMASNQLLYEAALMQSVYLPEKLLNR